MFQAVDAVPAVAGAAVDVAVVVADDGIAAFGYFSWHATSRAASHEDVGFDDLLKCALPIVGSQVLVFGIGYFLFEGLAILHELCVGAVGVDECYFCSDGIAREGFAAGHAFWIRIGPSHKPLCEAVVALILFAGLAEDGRVDGAAGCAVCALDLAAFFFPFGLLLEIFDAPCEILGEFLPVFPGVERGRAPEVDGGEVAGGRVVEVRDLVVAVDAEVPGALYIAPGLDGGDFSGANFSVGAEHDGVEGVFVLELREGALFDGREAVELVLEGFAAEVGGKQGFGLWQSRLGDAQVGEPDLLARGTECSPHAGVGLL